MLTVQVAWPPVVNLKVDPESGSRGRGRNTMLSGMVTDQAALHGLLIKVRDLNLTLVSVRRIEPVPEEGLRDLLSG